MHTNTVQQLAWDYITQTGASVFLTGKAGTGKTTLLRRLKEECPKAMAVLAPTGVAAIHAGGVTIHSFFQLPFGPFLPIAARQQGPDGAVGEHGLISRLRFGRDKRELLQSLDLLVIDEVSMVRADVMDAIDTILRHVRRNPSPFGGVQMLFIGDLYQLPPVVKEEEWSLLQQHYQGPFFFYSKVIQQQPPVYVELQTIYRQNDAAFIQVLNEVRNNQLTPKGFELLNSRHMPQQVQHHHRDGWITLTTHNAKAGRINEEALQQLPGAEETYRAEVTGDFPDKAFPAEELLTLKEGAQVMFLKNDMQGRRYYNGKIGVVKQLFSDKVVVACEGEEKNIEVRPEVWRQVSYTLNKTLQQVEEEELGTFMQLPLRLAWAITIHKSQGLTFDKAIIDAAASFSAGQAYVALSRCRSLDGLVLQTPLPPQAVQVDHRVVHYSSLAPDTDALKVFFNQAQLQYQQRLLTDACASQRTTTAFASMAQVWQSHESSLGVPAVQWAQPLQQKADTIAQTAGRFVQQLTQHFKVSNLLPEADPFVQQRSRSAAQWFVPALQELLTQVQELPAVSDSQEIASLLEDALAEAVKALRQWIQLMQTLENGFEPMSMVRARTKAVIADVAGLAYAGSHRHEARFLESTHPELEEQLRQWRNQQVKASGKPVYTVFGNSALAQVAQYLPQTPDDLLQLSGFGPAKVKQYGTAILEIVQTYTRKEGLTSGMSAHTAGKRKKTTVKKNREPEESKPISSSQQSFDLWKQGKTIEEIAAIRQLKFATIESHISEFVLAGDAPISAVIPENLFQQICEVIIEINPLGMGPVKEILGDAVSYSQIRLAMQWLEKQQANKQTAQ